jgi:CRISPR/Cas system CMR subunit Cmr4 (Cas7 group RAMP superfamily)
LKKFNDINKAKNLIDICIEDFNAGFLNIGGEGSIGGGFIKMEAGAWQ